MRPYDVKSENDNLAMTSDNHPHDAERWSILNFADKVSLHPPANTDWVGWVEIPRDQFNAIVDWYIKDQAPPATDHVVGTKPIALISEGTLRLLLQDTGGTFRISAPKWPTETETIPLYLAVPPATDHVVGSELNGIAEQLADGSGVWLSCTGCHELNEGVPTGPYSSIMKCHLGMGCRECGGIGAIWDTTDYEDMGNALAEQAIAEEKQPDHRHEFFPNKKYPWFCAHCGYAPHELLKHFPPAALSAEVEG